MIFFFFFGGRVKLAALHPEYSNMKYDNCDSYYN